LTTCCRSPQARTRRRRREGQTGAQFLLGSWGRGPTRTMRGSDREPRLRLQALGASSTRHSGSRDGTASLARACSCARRPLRIIEARACTPTFLAFAPSWAEGEALRSGSSSDARRVRSGRRHHEHRSSSDAVPSPRSPSALSTRPPAPADGDGVRDPSPPHRPGRALPQLPVGNLCAGLSFSSSPPRPRLRAGSTSSTVSQTARDHGADNRDPVSALVRAVAEVRRPDALLKSTDDPHAYEMSRRMS